ncbi:MAG: hypothetical protein JSW40_07890 [Candidatus Omnitrophota bacterium]|nr:MAG: hypothetical protein JSW40_07890 [Candidatus Omnitrophota bacterium]
MKFLKLLNPAYVYKRRFRIGPSINRRLSPQHRKLLRKIPHFTATHGFPLTANDRKLITLKNKYRGKRCFILGNGPSLKYQNLKLLRNEFTFVTNWFVLHEEFLNLRKCFYCVGDPHFWNYGKYIHPELLDKLSQHKSVICFFDYYASSLLREQNKLPRDTVRFMRLDLSKKVWEGNFSTDILEETCWGLTIIIDVCLPIAFYMGFTSVYLMGCDCDYKLDEAKDFSKAFFHDVSQIPEADLANLSIRREQGHFENFDSQIRKSYSTVRSYFESHGRKVRNAGYGGRLDIFERVNYNDLF